MNYLIFTVLLLAGGGVESAGPLSECISSLILGLGKANVITDSAEIPATYNKVFDEYIPGAFVTPSNGSEVAFVLNTALEYNITVAVRSFAGHSYIGQSTVGSEGIVMSLENLSKFEVRPSTAEAVLGAGLTLLEVYSRLAMHSPPFGLNGGTCPSVGVSGLISGGGEGMTSTFGGITSDRLVAAKAVVFQNGQYTEIAADTDLLFALRGGMGGNYGVVTEWTVSVFPVTNVVVFSYKTAPMVSGDDGKLHLLFRGFMGWVRDQALAAGWADSVWGIAKIVSGGVAKFNGQCFCGSDYECTECKSAIAMLESTVFTGLKGVTQVLEFGHAMWTWAGCTNWSGTDAYPPGGLQGISEKDLQAAMAKCMDYDATEFGGPYKSKSLYMPHESLLYPEFEADGLKLVTQHDACVTGQCYLQMSFVGGAMVTEHSNSAFEHRIPGWHLQANIYWVKSVADSVPYLEWSRLVRNTFLPFSLNEGYQNYPDLDLSVETWTTEYFPRDGTLEKLMAAKCKYNSARTMDVPQSLSHMIPREC